MLIVDCWIIFKFNWSRESVLDLCLFVWGIGFGVGVIILIIIVCLICILDILKLV